MTMADRPPPEPPPPHRPQLQLQPPMVEHIPSTGTAHRETMSGEVSHVDDLMNLLAQAPTFPGRPTKRRHRRRRWRRRKLIVRKRKLRKSRLKRPENERPLLSTRQKKRHSKKKNLSKIDNMGTVWLKGVQGCRCNTKSRLVTNMSPQGR